MPFFQETEGPDWGIGGSLYTNFNTVAGPANARDSMVEEGLIEEMALHVTGHLTPRFTVRGRACYGCHGLEIEEAYAEFRFSEALAIRVGRMNVPFGGFVGRHDPAINELSSKPLPYAMGMMPRSREFNQGVIPAPFVDTAVSILGRVEPARSIILDYEIYGARGLQGERFDFNFIASRDFEDNNGEPAGGARLTATVEDVSIGGSVAFGHFDPDHELQYLILGIDTRFDLGPVTVRGEYLWRRTEYVNPLDATDQNNFIKQGYYVQFTYPVDDRLSIFLMHDGLAVEDMFLSAAGVTAVAAAAVTDDANRILRFVSGVNFRPHASILLKGSAEYWEFSDFDDVWVFNAGMVVEF